MRIKAFAVSAVLAAALMSSSSALASNSGGSPITSPTNVYLLYSIAMPHVEAQSLQGNLYQNCTQCGALSIGKTIRVRPNTKSGEHFVIGYVVRTTPSGGHVTSTWYGNPIRANVPNSSGGVNKFYDISAFLYQQPAV
jgi:hypothetical protein